MSEGSMPVRRRKIWAAILVVAAVVLLALAACMLRPIYCAGRVAQSAADGAVLGGARLLAHTLQQQVDSEDQIIADMLSFATRNGLDGNDQVVGYYLDAGGNRLRRVGTGKPQDPRGIEAVVTVRVPTLGRTSLSWTGGR